jgi:hypothetical protein
MLFTNIDITGSILALILKNLAKDQGFQEKLRGEIALQRSSPSYGVADYIAKQNTFLHYVTMESIRVTPSMCECRSAAFLLRIPRIDVLRADSTQQTSLFQNAIRALKLLPVTQFHRIHLP